MAVKIFIEDKFYKKYDFFDAHSLKKLDIININPIENKLFSGDIFNIENNKVNLIYSIVRSSKIIAGILIKNKTYGRNEKNKFMYKCIPNDKRLPDFLIGISNKIKDIYFNKNIINTYITFSFLNWNDKHPIGELKQTIGNVNEIINFYEYQLYCKNLNFTLQNFNNAANRILKKSKEKNIIQDIYLMYENIEDRLHEYAFTIDNKNSYDLDDALSIEYYNNNKAKVSIYISNVAYLIDYFQLWESFSERISTIYLPDKNRPMLPTILSDHLCSLKENESRIVYGIDIYIDNDRIEKIEYKNSIIKVRKNFIYESDELLKNINYINLVNLSKKICKHKKYLPVIQNSHDLITYYMLFINNQMAILLSSNKLGIYRSLSNNNCINIPHDLPKDVEKFVKYLFNTSGKYSKYEDRNTINCLNNEIDIYLHISSPIRRLVDLLNLIKLEDILNNKKLSDSSDIFFNKWYNKLDYINETTKSIKKVQNICRLLFNFSNNSEFLDKIYNGYILEKLQRSDGLFYYNIFIPDIKLVSKLVIKDDLKIYNSYNFKIYIFISEINIKKKLRLEILF